MIQRVFFRLAAIFVGLVVLPGVERALAQETFYKGKSITLIVNYPPGGGADAFGRLIARHLPKHVPGEPSVIVQNMGGAGGVIGGNYLYEVAKPDGLTVGALTGVYMPQILGGSGVRLDLNNMAIIAASAETSVAYIRADAGVKGASDILKPAKPIVVGGMSRENAGDLSLRMALDLLGVPYRYVTGYKGTAERRLAVQRSEINYTSETLSGYATGLVPLVRDGTAVPLYQEGVLGPEGDIVRDRRLDLPAFNEFFRKATGRDSSGPLLEAYKIIAGVRSLQRHIVVPPKTPAGLVQILRKSLRGLFEDAEFKAESERIFSFQLVTFVGEEAEKVRAAAFQAAAGPGRDVLIKMAQ